MHIDELDYFLRQYSDQELRNMAGIDPVKTDVYDVYEDVPDEDGNPSRVYIFEDDYFISSYENMGMNKQDRYARVLPHKHNYIELLYVWSGRCTQWINGKRVICREGDICILDTQTVHSMEATGEDDLIVNILMRKEFFAATFFNRMTKQGIMAEFLISAVEENRNKKQYLLFQTENDPKIRQILSQLILEFYGEDLGKREVMESYVVILFTCLLRLYRENPADSPKHYEANRKILDILEYIEKNFESCDLDTLADHFGLNGKYITMMLKKRTGRSFVEHLQEQKLNKARLLLVNTDLSVAEIINLCGYSNMNFFYKKFVQAQGCKPAEYREQMLKLEQLK